MAGNKAAQERAARRKAELEQRKRDERAARREAHRLASLAGSSGLREPVAAENQATAQTFGEMIERKGLVEKVSAVTRRLISESVAQANELGRTSLKVLPSCHTCAAPKGCCKDFCERVPV